MPHTNTTKDDKLLLRRAEHNSGDLFMVRKLLAASSLWMHTASKGHAWPRDGFPNERIIPSLQAGEVWLLFNGRKPVGTITLDQNPEQEFTAPAAVLADVPDMLPHAWIGHRLATDRTQLGYGSLLVQWSIDWAYRRGAQWRLTNVARDADRLQAWYRGLGFKKLALVTTTKTPEGKPRKSGYLMYTQARPIPGVYARLIEIS